ncbi:MAG: hypothetical protein KKB50_06370 [Planctomycetes bacterium]|nr:hypothetical protein [Planctomycetota bacterium]
MRVTGGVALILLAGLALSAKTAAQDKSPVDAELWAIRATTKNSEISPELRSLADSLKKQFKYTGFKVEKKARERVNVGKSFSAALIGGYQATVTAKSRDSDRIQLQVEVTKQSGGKAKTVLRATTTVKAGPFVPYGCGSLDGGDYLIMAVRAR